MIKDWQLALVTFAVVPPLIFVMVIWARHARAAFINVRIKISQLYGTLGENVCGVRAIQSMSREGENSPPLRLAEPGQPERQHLGRHP